MRNGTRGRKVPRRMEWSSIAHFGGAPGQHPQRTLGGSAPRDGPHRVHADDDRRSRIERELVADLAAAQQLAEEAPSRGGRPTKTRLASRSTAVTSSSRAVDPEAATELVHRHVRPALDEAAELGAVQPVDVAGRSAVLARAGAGRSRSGPGPGSWPLPAGVRPALDGRLCDGGFARVIDVRRGGGCADRADAALNGRRREARRGDGRRAPPASRRAAPGRAPWPCRDATVRRGGGGSSAAPRGCGDPRGPAAVMPPRQGGVIAVRCPLAGLPAHRIRG